MSVKTITGTVTDSGGASIKYTGTITVNDTPIVDLITVVPAAAPAGTLRTITIAAHDPNTPPQTLTYTCLVNGVAATPTALPNVFTMVV